MAKRAATYIAPDADADVSTETLIAGEAVDNLAAVLVAKASATWTANPSAYPASEFVDYVQDMVSRATSIRRAIRKMRNIPHR